MTAALRIDTVGEMLAELDAIAPVAMSMPHLRASVEDELRRGRPMLDLSGKLAGIESTMHKARKHVA